MKGEVVLDNVKGVFIPHKELKELERLAAIGRIVEKKKHDELLWEKLKHEERHQR